MGYVYRGNTPLAEDPDVQDETNDAELKRWRGKAHRYEQLYQQEREHRMELQERMRTAEAEAMTLRGEVERLESSAQARGVGSREWRRRHYALTGERDRLRSLVQSYQATTAQLREESKQHYLTSQMLRQRLTALEGVVELS